MIVFYKISYILWEYLECQHIKVIFVYKHNRKLYNDGIMRATEIYESERVSVRASEANHNDITSNILALGRHFVYKCYDVYRLNYTN